MTDHLRLEQPDDRLGQRVIVRVTDAADRRRNTRFRQTLRVANGQVLHAAIAVMDQPGIVRESRVELERNLS